MVSVQITYKSGKVEVIEIALRHYVSTLTTLADEGQLAEFKII